MLRAALHVLVSGSLLAGPPTTREYTGDDAVIEAPNVGGTTPVVPESPPTGLQPPPGAVAPTGAPLSTEGTSSASATAPSASTPETSTPPPVQPEGPAEDEEEDADEVPYDPLVDSPEAQRARSWVRSGAVFIGIGAVLTGGGIGMSQAKVNTLAEQEACDPRRDHAGNGCLEEARNRATAALLIPGVLLLAGGIAMLTVGKLQQKRLRADLRASRRELVLGLQWAF
ncbi:hypothetical protein SAMN02745121_00717 [Nannocystis exedens]|uniref:Uncharacterized protein n=1 Tax=Nannocystis exedens TaxID=54 RepID=A0A1I1THT5_9BACT|nr:hypothetical protein [Nannocystis exedens]PCC66554.1 hypothetical protein NAEX_09142 [Nannocystis exedens]SFD58124.1 hypothetical protein SAMN02745121_00717 [Nannocystis exedens]